MLRLEWLGFLSFLVAFVQLLRAGTNVPKSLRKMTSSKTLRMLFAICFVMSSILVVGCGSRQESFYATLSDADKDGAITRGWIPDDMLPSDSHAIHEVHELSPSTEWCAFEFSPTNSEVLRKGLKGVDELPPSVKHVPSPGVSWWPSMLTGNLDVSKIRKAGFELFIIKRPATSVTTEVRLFAVDSARGRAFFYTTSKAGSSVEKSPFSLSVVPQTSHEEPFGSAIEMAHNKPREFFVVLTNVSPGSQPVWEYWNSWGYQNISFELTTADGKKFGVSKRQEDFTRNFPSTFRIASGEHQVYAIRLDGWWETHPLLPKTDEMPIALKAIYEVPPTAEAAQYHVWTGHLESRSYELKLRQW
jgi:hypothetical protein